MGCDVVVDYLGVVALRAEVFVDAVSWLGFEGVSLAKLSGKLIKRTSGFSPAHVRKRCFNRASVDFAEVRLVNSLLQSKRGLCVAKRCSRQHLPTDPLIVKATKLAVTLRHRFCGFGDRIPSYSRVVLKLG